MPTSIPEVGTRLPGLIGGVLAGVCVDAIAWMLLPRGGFDDQFWWNLALIVIGATAVGVGLHRRTQSGSLFGAGLAIGALLPFVTVFCFLAALGLAIGS